MTQYDRPTRPSSPDSVPSSQSFFQNSKDFTITDSHLSDVAGNVVHFRGEASTYADNRGHRSVVNINVTTGSTITINANEGQTQIVHLSVGRYDRESIMAGICIACLVFSFLHRSYS